MRCLLLAIALCACGEPDETVYKHGAFTVVTHAQAEPPNDLPEYLQAIQARHGFKDASIEFFPGYYMLGVAHRACDYDGHVIRIRTTQSATVTTKQTCLPHEMAHHLLQSKRHDDLFFATEETMRL